MRFLLPIALLAAVAWAADDPGVVAFTQRVDQYVKIRDAATRKVSPLPKTATAEQIEKYEQGMVTAIRAARLGAKQGDVFVPEVRPILLRILTDNFAGAAKENNRTAARQGNPERDRDKGESAPLIQVNAIYSKSAPLSTVPPQLLLQLPKLPKDIEYRFSGQTLILWDNLSNLIIDYMKGAAPGL